jgi:hypothetical protein
MDGRQLLKPKRSTRRRDSLPAVLNGAFCLNFMSALSCFENFRRYTLLKK